VEEAEAKNVPARRQQASRKVYRKKQEVAEEESFQDSGFGVASSARVTARRAPRQQKKNSRWRESRR